MLGKPDLVSLWINPLHKPRKLVSENMILVYKTMHGMENCDRFFSLLFCNVLLMFYVLLCA